MLWFAPNPDRRAGRITRTSGYRSATRSATGVDETLSRITISTEVRRPGSSCRVCRHSIVRSTVSWQTIEMTTSGSGGTACTIAAGRCTARAPAGASAAPGEAPHGTDARGHVGAPGDDREAPDAHPPGEHRGPGDAAGAVPQGGGGGRAGFPVARDQQQ